jgi:ATP-dependent protease ClpP protease subunit
MAMFWTRMSEATGTSVEHLRHDAREGRFLSAEEAVTYGLADEVAAPDARIHRLPGRSIGFGPR